MAKSSHSDAVVADEGEPEWEYEYSETETESFYMTLDLSSASNNLRPQRERSTTAPLAGDDHAKDLDGAAHASQSSAVQQDRVLSAYVTGSTSKATVSSFEAEDKIQILDLHSTNPIVSYQNQIYSCEWTSAIGTDVLMITSDQEFKHPVLRELSDISVIAVTSIKLAARPVKLEPRHKLFTQAESDNRSPTLGTASHTGKDSRSNAIKIPPNLAPSRARLDQANFLERLIAAKAARGEKDQVTIFAQRVPQGSGWRSQQKAAAQHRTSENPDEEELEEVVSKSTPLASRQVGRPRASRPAQKRTARTAKGGLFRDYRPQLWDTAGVDVRNDFTRTPDTWEKLGQDMTREQSVGQGVTLRSSQRPEQEQAAEGNADSAAQEVSDLDMEETQR